MSILADMQLQLSELYQLDTEHRIADYLITDRRLASLLGAEPLLEDSDETVLLTEDEQGMAMSVYLEGAMLNRLENAGLDDLRPAQLPDWWTALEGVSHFVYLVRSAEREQTVTLLELEMQAEVDKFVSAWQLALLHDDAGLAEQLHGWLFDEVSFHDQLRGDQLERYRTANDYAGRFCHGLRARLREGGSPVLDELRYFYRLSQAHKISHIHAHAWGNA